MDRLATRGITTVLTAVLTLGVWGCGGSSPNYSAGDGGVARDSGKSDGGGTTDATVPDGGTADGAGLDGGGEDGAIGDGAVADAEEPGPPVVTMLAPAEGSAYKTSLALEFSVNAPAGMKAQAPEVTVDSKVVSVVGLTTPSTGDVEYLGSASYSMALSCQIGGLAEGSHQIGVRVWDTQDREGTGAASFVIDCSGPTLTPIKPLPAVIVGGPTVFMVTIADGAGIVDSSATLELTEAGQTVSLQLLRLGGGPSSGDFGVAYDTGALPQPMIRPQILFRAADKLGNEAHVAYQIGIDNTPPVVGLTSAGVYVGKWADCWAMCGDGVCEEKKGEDAGTCPRDCLMKAGDGVCSPSETDPADCGPRCGDGTCELQRGENAGNCAADCPATCGDGICSSGEAATCPDDCPATCGDGACLGGESAVTCAADCLVAGCGNGVCEAGETPASCARDCVLGCGNGVCEVDENVRTCPADCVSYDREDGVCSDHEDCDNSPADCGYCREQVCPEDDLVLECSRRTETAHGAATVVDPLANWTYAYAVGTSGTPRPSGWVHLQDGATVPQALYMRARVEDRGNSVSGASVVPVASVDRTSVRLYLLHHDKFPLVTENSSGACAINENLVETTQVDITDDNQVLVIDMEPVPTGGNADYRFWGDTSSPPGDFPAECGSRGDPGIEDAPKKRCTDLGAGYQASYVISTHEVGDVPAVYSVAPVESSGPLCEGPQIDLGYMQTDRWFCAAVAARDNAGNRSVSRPLHLCLSRYWMSGGPCDSSPTGSCASTTCAASLPAFDSVSLLAPDK